MIKNHLAPSFKSLDEIQHWVLMTIFQYGEETRPRGMQTLELFPVSLTLLNPRSRCILNPVRKWSFPLALGEFCWHVSGSNELQFIEHYAPRWRDFTEDGVTVRGSCYGHRVFNRKEDGTSQWERLVKLLRSDLHTRRAILYFSDSTDSFDNISKDVPCASTLQFIVRSGRLHAITNMRSNDAIWGLPYDIFLFTMFQELLACQLNVEIGTYSHVASSLHLYERHYALARDILTSDNAGHFEMPHMSEHMQLPIFLSLEGKIRSRVIDGVEEEERQLNNYWRSLLSVLKQYSESRFSSNKIPYKSPADFGVSLYALR